MSRLGKITRRTLLVGAVAVAGGAAFGIYQIRKPVTNPLRPEQGASLNPYVIIDQHGISIIAPRAEMGQGVHTTLAALVAEELDADWESVRVLHGPPAAAYYNAALAHGALPVPGYAMKDWQRSVTEGLGAATKLLGLQVTGGSTSTIDGFTRMRMAGASAREALKAVAAERLGVEIGALRTQAGQVIGPDGTEIDYRDLAEAAALRPVPQVALRSPDDWKLLGR
ncbi:MAG: xanthine dehydrogenase family protein molybdopterin-binding subunit, partial [Roseinatronobacter sp.]